jgi:hypothetical protein
MISSSTITPIARRLRHSPEPSHSTAICAPFNLIG